MDDQVKIYDTVRGDQFLYYNPGYNTTNSTKLKKNSHHWTNIFTWKKKAKQPVNSIIDYPFVSAQKYCSMSAATGIAYTFAPPPARLPPHSPPSVPAYSSPDVLQDYITATTTTTTTIHASVRHNPMNRQVSNRNSLFYSPWESFHDHSAHQSANDCTCQSSGAYGPKSKPMSLRGVPSKSVPSIPTVSSVEPIYESRRLSRMDLYSVEEEANYHKTIEPRSKSSDSLLDMKKANQPSNGLKSCRSSTTLNGNPYSYKTNKPRDGSSATVNERFLKFFKKSSSDPYNSIASRKSILECDVSAYDLIEQNIEQKIYDDDMDDNLSDNAIENESKYEEKTVKSSGHKSSHTNSKVKSEAFKSRHSVTANSVRIGGIGMSLTAPVLKYKSISQSAKSKIYSKIKSRNASTSSWSSGEKSPEESRESIPLPEPDYDSDDDEDTNTYANASNYGAKRFGLISHTPSVIDICDKEDDIYDNNFDKQSEYSSRDYLEYDRQKRDSEPENSSMSDRSLSQTPSTSSEPPSPPPEPPLPPTTQPIKPLNLSLARPKASLSKPNVTSYQCELKDKLNSGVKSILKKTQSPLNSGKLAKDHCLSKSETDLKGSTAATDSCDYLRTFKEFKESRLRPNGRHRKHVHFKSLSHDRLIINEISAQTIPEVEESDEPIYDDVRLPGNASPGSASDDDSGSNGQQSSDDKENNKSEQLNAISDSITSCNNRTIASAPNDYRNDNRDHCLTATQATPVASNAQTPVEPRAVPPIGAPVEFQEFDPSEDSSPSTSPTSALRGPTLASPQTKHRPNRVDLNTKHNSLAENHNDFDAINDNCKRNSFIGRNAYEAAMKATDNCADSPVRGQTQASKNVLPSPAANSGRPRALSTGADCQPTQNSTHLKVPIVERKFVPTLSVDSANMAPVAKPRDDRPQGKYNTQVKTDAKPVAQARAHKSSLSSGLNSNRSLSAKEETIGDQKYEELKSKSGLAVSRDAVSGEHENCVPTKKKPNLSQLLDSNRRETKNRFANNDNNNTEIKVSADFNRGQTLTAIEPTVDDNCLAFESRPVIDDYGLNSSKSNPYLCTISIKNGSNNQIINQTHIETNVNAVCLSTPFESMSSHSSSSFYDSGAQSSIDSLTNDRSLKSLDESPITILCANSNDKIVINVPSDHTFDNINEHIYEELDTESIYVETDPSLDNVKSIFDGASKDEILEFLEDAKERVGEDILVDTTQIDTNIELLEAIDIIQDIDDSSLISATNRIEASVQSSSRRNRTSNVSNSSTDSTATTTSSSIDIEEDILKCPISNSSSVGQLVERNDSGVGTETSKPSRHRKLSLNDEVEHQCADCEMHVDPNEDDQTGLLHYPLFCHRCDKKRSERKEIISEIVDTEFKYGRDLRIIREEFYRPIEIAGLLTKEQLRGVFLNLDELIGVNSKFSEKLQDAIDIATEQGDEDFTTVNIGKLFRDSSSMLHAFEVYCVRQGSAALLLNHLEKEKELLRIFLRVSQMENTLLRRMNLRSFLVVPVQRVTKYPLLLNRLYKVTPYHHRDREALRESQQKVELHLEHINQQTKGTIGATTRIWRRISNLSTSHRRLNSTDDIGNIKLRKAALEILKWNQEETQFVLIGKVFITSITDYTVNRKTKTMKFLTANALLATLGRPNQNYRPDLVNRADVDKDMVFNRDNTGITDAVLLLIKEKIGRYALCKEILNLKTCVVSTEMESGDEMFEIHEQMSKESLLFKAESVTETRDWLKQLKYHSKDLGNWRRRRNALANIMMVRQ